MRRVVGRPRRVEKDDRFLRRNGGGERDLTRRRDEVRESEEKNEDSLLSEESVSSVDRGSRTRGNEMRSEREVREDERRGRIERLVRSRQTRGGDGLLSLYQMTDIFVEKILRVQPHVKKLYLLLRANDAESASQRFYTEVVSKDLFNVLKEKYGENLQTFLAEKVTLVAGDITHENLGVHDPLLCQQMWRDVDVVVNVAASTVFNERLDIKQEKMIIEDTLNKLKFNRDANDKTITLAMKDLGMRRANHYGWPNTYVFTKALGEMILGQSRGDMPLVIFRPTIITSTYKEPFPGWIEGIRTADSMLAGYGKGRINCFLGDPESVYDAVPADMVVNAMLATIVANANETCSQKIYHVGSSVSNPLKFSIAQKCAYLYFTQNPWIDNDGKPVTVGKVTVLKSVQSFLRYITIRYLLPLCLLKVVNVIFCKALAGTYNNLKRKIDLVQKLVKLYEPYLFSKSL
ncbi:jojoba acyl CoA reductase-related male sterility protein [Tanacetum coccineum]